MTRRVVIEADGGSRGNPGPAAYGAVLKDADTGEVIAEDGSTIGVASNNVAEYNGLIAGLRLAADLAPDADIEVRMDSKLVVEQMSGNWKIKHPDMVPLALEANRLAPFGTTYTWVPREQNKHADRLANEALDGKRSGVTVITRGDDLPPTESEPTESTDASRAELGRLATPGADHAWCWCVTASPTTPASGGSPAGCRARTPASATRVATRSAPPPTGWRRSANGSMPSSPRPYAAPASPARSSPNASGVPLEDEPGFAEMEFGTWDGMTFDEVAATEREALEKWLGSLDERPGGGESLVMVQERVLAALERLLARHAGRTVVVASHVTPIKVVVAEALQAPLTSQFRMELRPASVTVVTFFTPPDGETVPGETQRYASLRQLNMLAPGVDLFDESTRW